MTDVEEPITVLVVDDDRGLGDVTSAHLERRGEGIETLVTRSASAALELLDDGVDCVVSDYEMPGRNGLDFLRDVRDYDAALPFILFTGRGSEEIASEAISAGVTDYLQKGAGTDQYAVLANRIRNAVAHRRSAAAAAETESRYRTLVESSPHAILVHDGDEIRYVNDRLVDLVGGDDPDQLVGRDPFSFVHSADGDAVAERISAVIENGDRPPWREFRLERLDGEVRRVESRPARVIYDGSRASQAVLRDVTDRHRRERRLEALHEATRRLLTADDRAAVGAITLDVLENVFDEPVAAVWEHDPRVGGLAMLAVTENASRVVHDAGFELELSPLPEWTVEVDAFESGEPRVVDRYGDRADAVTGVFETVFLYPLDDHGLLAIGSTDNRTFDDSERDLVGVLARSVTAAFDRLESE